MEMYKTFGNSFSELVKVQDSSYLDLAQVERSPCLVARSEWSSEMRRLHTSSSFITVDDLERPLIMAIDDGFYDRFPQLKHHQIAVRKNHMLFSGIHITGPPPKPGFSKPKIDIPVKSMVFKNTARVKEQKRKIKKAAKDAAKKTKSDLINIQRSVTLALFKRNRYDLLGEELDDVIIESPIAKQKKYKIPSVRIKKLKIPKIRIFKVKSLNKPIFENQAYYQNLVPSALSTRSNSNENIAEKPSYPAFVKNFKKLIQTPMFQDQAWTDVGQLFSMDCILTSLMSNISMDEFLQSLERLKPINLANLIGMALAAQDFKTILGIVTAAFELYDYFWTVPSTSTHIFCLFLAYAVHWLIKLIRFTFSDETKPPNMFWDESSFVPTEEENTIRDWLKEHLSLDLEQVPKCVMPLIGGIIGVIALITGGSFTNWTDLKFNKILNRLDKFTKSLKKIDNAMEIVPKVFTQVISTVAGLFGYEYISTEDKCVIDFKAELMEFKKEVTHLSDMMQIEPVALLQSSEKLGKMSRIMDSLDKQYEKLIKQKFNTASVKPILDDIKVSVKKIHNWARIRNQHTATKIEPVFLQLSGAPGVGKSRIVEYILDKLALKAGRTERFTTYTRNCVEKFWALYAGQDVVVIDEFNQTKEDSDHNDIMTVKNPNKCSVNMAVADEKGQQFTSAFIIACSNGLDVLASATIKWGEALNRRRDVLVLVDDPNLDDFKAKYGVFPGSYINPENESEVGNPIVERDLTIDVEGVPTQVSVKMPYFDKDFRHLTFWEIPSLPGCRTEAYKRTNPDKIVSLMMAHHQKFLTAYKASLANSNLLIQETPIDNNQLEINSEDGSLASSISQEEYYDLMHKNATPDNALRKIKVEPSIAKPPSTQKEVKKIQKLARQQQQARELKEHYEAQFWTNPSCSDDYPEYIDHDAKTTAKSFVNCSGKKGKVFSLVGPAGTGKSRFFDLIQQRWGEHVDRVHATNLHNHVLSDKRILIIDDISITKTSAQLAMALTNAVYDGESPVKLLYISYNKTSMDTYYSGVDEREMFLRRCHPVRVDFNIKEKKTFSKDVYFNYIDTENATSITFPKMVYYTDIRNRKIMESTQLISLFTDVDLELNTVVTSYCVNVPEIDPLLVNPEFIVKFDTPMFEACKILYNNPAQMITWLTTGKCRLEKGAALDGISVARQFTTPNTAEKPTFPDSLDQFICMINNSQFMSEKPFVTRLDASDVSLIIMPKLNNPKLIRCFKVNSELEILRDAIKTKGTEEEKEMMNEATKQEYGDFFDFIKQHAESVAAAVTNATEQMPILAGAASIFDQAPFLKNAFSVCAFYLRFIMAGTAISSLLSHHDTCKLLFEKNFKPPLNDEKKKQRIKYDAHIYEDFRETIDSYGSKSAKQLKVSQATRAAYAHFGHLDYTEDQFKNFLQNYGNESREVQQPQALQQFTPAATAFDIALVPNLTIESKPLVYDEAMIDSSSATIMQICSDHAVSIVKRQGDQYIHIVHGLMVRGHIGCSVAHFVESDCDYYAQYMQRGEIKRSPIHILKTSHDFDVSIFKITDKTCEKFKNILHFLPTIKTNIAQVAGDQNGILQTTTLNTRHKHRDRMPRNVQIQEVVKITSNSGLKTALTYTGTITHIRTQGQILTEAGDCGSPIILCNPKTPVKILALHNAADTQFGAGSLIFQEYFRFFDDEAKIFQTVEPLPHSAVKLIDHQTDFVCDMPVVGTGEVNTSLPTKTKLWTSPLKLSDANPYQPAILSQHDSRNVEKIHPYYKSVKKWAHVQPNLNLDILNRAVDEIAEFYADTCFINGEKTPLLTTTDAINAGGNAGLCQLNRATSPGYPWIKYAAKKQEFLKMNGKNENVYWSIDYEKQHPRLNCKPGQLLSDAVNQLLLICKSRPDIKPLIVFAGHIKDEPVKLKKIYDVSSRSFAGAPFDYVIAMRRYYGSAVSAIHNVRHIVPSKIGINPTSLEWHNMFSRMLEVSDIGFDADYQNFDSTIPAIVLKQIPKIYNRIYQKCDPNWKAEDDIVRENLNNALIEPLLCVPFEGQTKIVQAPGGHVSGQPLTADTNCLVNLIYLYMCWLETFKDKPDFQNFNTFISKVEPIIYGDDICVAVCPEVIHEFNCETLYYFLQSLGITITDAAKTAGVPKPYIPCHQFEFLKRNFIKNGMYYVGPLKLASFEKMLGYTIGDPHHWDLNQNVLQFNYRVLQSTMESALQEAVFHGPKFYNYIKQHCLNFCKKYNWQFTPLGFNQMVDFKGVPLTKI